MKRLIIILLALFFIIQSSSAQEYQTEVKNRLSFKVMPLSLLSQMHRVRFGLEFISKGRFGYNLDAGFGNEATFILPSYARLLDDNRWEKDYQFFEIRPEVKYLYINKKHLYLYSAIELFYMQMNTTMIEGKYKKKGVDFAYSYDQANLHTKKYGFIYKMGLGIVVASFSVEFYAGIGLANIEVKYSDVVNAQKINRFSFDRWFNPYVREQNRETLHLDLGIKIGYVLIQLSDK